MVKLHIFSILVPPCMFNINVAARLKILTLIFYDLVFLDSSIFWWWPIHRQWNRTVYHGGDTDVLGLRWYLPDAVPVETRLLPASSRFITVFDSLLGYSRWVPVVLNILKQPGTWAGLTRFNKVHPGSPRLSTVPPRLWHGSSWITKPGWTGTLNRDSENGA